MISGLPEKVQDKLVARIELLEEKGYELRRPHADILRDGIHELRTRHIKVQYRVLYFFCDKAAVLSHGLTKEDIVPPFHKYDDVEPLLFALLRPFLRRNSRGVIIDMTISRLSCPKTSALSALSAVNTSPQFRPGAPASICFRSHPQVSSSKRFFHLWLWRICCGCSPGRLR